MTTNVPRVTVHRARDAGGQPAMRIDALAGARRRLPGPACEALIGQVGDEAVRPRNLKTELGASVDIDTRMTHHLAPVYAPVRVHFSRMYIPV